MSFASILDAYCNAIGCTNREIAARCGISPSTLSRYRNGERTPERDSDTIDRLVAGITELSNERGVDKAWRTDIVRSALETSLPRPRLLGVSFASRFDALMELLGLRNAEVAQALDVSPSYVSRIRSGQRVPADKRAFAEECARFLARRSEELGQQEELARLVDSSDDPIARAHSGIDDRAVFIEAIEQWLLGDNIMEADLAALRSLFDKMNDRYYEDYLNDLDETAPNAPKPETSDQQTQVFYGIERLQEAEAVFFKTALAHGAKEIFLSSDMPMLEQSLAPDFARKVASGIGRLTRAGAHITAIHSYERPFVEAVSSIEMWLPLYLAGQISAYYLKGATNKLFCRVNYVCESCILSSEGTRSSQPDGRHYFSMAEEDIAYYRKKTNYILENAFPMVEIYHDDVPAQKRKLTSLRKSLDKDGEGRIVCAGRFENLSIISYSARCAIVTMLGESPVHLVLHHPKLCFVISCMK